MAIKTILVPLDGTEVSVDKLPTAHAAAARLGAHLDVIYLRRSAKESLPFVFGSLGSQNLRDTVLDAASQALDASRDQTRARFDTFCEQHDVRLIDGPPAPASTTTVTASWREDDSSALFSYCRLSDLVAIIRTPSDTQPWLLEATLLKAARPVLLVPPATPKTTTADFGRRAVIGWNDSAEAARAVSTALPLLALADQVSVLCSAKRASSARALINYLRWHQIDAQLHCFDAGQRSIAEALLNEAATLNADLFVAGGYSRTRASELLFGGVTKHFIDNAELPLLLAH